MPKALLHILPQRRLRLPGRLHRKSLDAHWGKEDGMPSLRHHLISDPVRLLLVDIPRRIHSELCLDSPLRPGMNRYLAEVMPKGLTCIALPGRARRRRWRVERTLHDGLDLLRIQISL